MEVIYIIGITIVFGGGVITGLYLGYRVELDRRKKEKRRKNWRSDNFDMYE